MLKNLTYKYRIYLTDEQKDTYKKLSDASTKLINLILHKVNDTKTYEYPNIDDLFYHLGQIRKEGHQEIFDVLYPSSVPLLLRRLSMGINMCKNKAASPPKEKNPDRYISSVIFNPIKENLKMDNKGNGNAYLDLKKFGKIKMVFHRPFPKDCICIATVIKKFADDKYYVYFILQGKFGIERERKFIPLEKTVGLDFSIKNFFVSSDPDIIPTLSNIIPSIKETELIELRHKNLIRKKAKSKSHEKSHIVLSKYTNRIKYRRMQEYYRLVNKILEKYDLVAVESLKMESIKRNSRYSKKIIQLGYIDFVKLLTYKATLMGKHVVKISPWFPSSKTCSHCGCKNDKLKIYDKEWVCPICKTTHQRDKNAAENIKNEGNRLYNLK